jgi:GAF domain-containing protein
MAENEGETLIPRLSFTVRYTLLGALFGFLFPLMAMAILLWIHALPVSLDSIIELQRTEPLLWIIDTAPLFLGLFASFAGRREDRLWRAYAHLRQDERRLQQLTEKLQRRGDQLMASSEVSSRLSTILNLEELLAEVVNQIQAKFGYYYTHIYLLDDKGESLVMAEGTGKAGIKMKAHAHNIAFDAPTSLVARAARSGEIVLAKNVHEEPDWLPNPLLSDTHSEIAVPILLEGQVVGVLDVQEDKIAGLDEGDVDLLRTLASQIAVAIRNAHLFDEVETALSRVQTAQERYLGQSWESFKTASGSGQHLYVEPKAAPLDEAKQQTLVRARQKAVAQKRSLVVADDNYLGGQSLAVPITLRDKTIGALQLYAPGDDNPTWNEDDLTLIETVVDQLAQTAETLRLFEETRQRVGREQTIREITDKLRAAPNLDILLETAARELGQRLGVRHTVLELGIETDSDDNNLVSKSVGVRE